MWLDDSTKRTNTDVEDVDLLSLKHREKLQKEM